MKAFVSHPWQIGHLRVFFLDFLGFTEASTNWPIPTFCILFNKWTLNPWEIWSSLSFPWKYWYSCDSVPTLQIDCGQSTFTIFMFFMSTICHTFLHYLSCWVGRDGVNHGRRGLTRGKDIHIHCHGIPHHVLKQCPQIKDPWGLIQKLDES